MKNKTRWIAMGMASLMAMSLAACAADNKTVDLSFAEEKTQDLEIANLSFTEEEKQDTETAVPTSVEEKAQELETTKPSSADAKTQNTNTAAPASTDAKTQDTNTAAPASAEAKTQDTNTAAPASAEAKTQDTNMAAPASADAKTQDTTAANPASAEEEMPSTEIEDTDEYFYLTWNPLLLNYYNSPTGHRALHADFADLAGEGMSISVSVISDSILMVTVRYEDSTLVTEGIQDTLTKQLDSMTSRIEEQRLLYNTDIIGPASVRDIIVRYTDVDGSVLAEKSWAGQ